MYSSLQEIEIYLHERKKYGIKPGLDRIKALLEKVGHPEKDLNAIHVAGTNGKGSTIQFIKNALVRNGYRVGLFTSPSFSGICGHIWINHRQISERDVISLWVELLPHIKELDKKGQYVTEFEIITVMAFLYLSNKVDVALIETGMGGRFDTTNCIHPLISIITTIAKDHMHYLGHRLEEIAYHKAGIIKQRCPVILGSMNKESSSVMHKEAKRNHANVYALYHDFTYTVKAGKLNWKGPDNVFFSFHLNMKGDHQAENAAVALMALLLLEKHYGIKMDWNVALDGMSETRLPGRFEEVNTEPTIILDSAHNVAGVKAFIHTVQEEYRYKEKFILFAGFKDKELPKMIALLREVTNEMGVTTFDHERAATIEQLEPYTISNESLRLVSIWQEEVLNMLTSKGKENKIFLITGSLHFVSMVRTFINDRKKSDYSDNCRK